MQLMCLSSCHVVSQANSIIASIRVSHTNVMVWSIPSAGSGFSVLNAGKKTLHEITCHCNVWLPASAVLKAMEEEWLENFGWNEPQNPLFHTTLKCNIFCKHGDSSLDDPLNKAMRQHLWWTAHNQCPSKDATSEGCIKTGLSLWRRTIKTGC